MNSTWVSLSALSSLLLSSVANAGVLPNVQKESQWFVDGQQSVIAKTKLTQRNKAKNVILFVGDGMGLSTLTAARILAGQNEGKLGEEGYLSFEKFPYSAQVKTYNVDAQTSDSAGTMTAIMSGVKTDAGVIGVDEDIARGDCSTAAGNELVTSFEAAEIKGLSTGIISTARITHATPAAVYAKSAERNWEDISDMPEDAIAAGCVDIATQLIDFEKNLEARFPGVDVNGIEVTFGGGRRHFLPKDEAYNSADASSAIEGDRTDGVDLTAKWQAQYQDGQYIIDQAGFDAIDANSTEHVLGLFNESHMQYEKDRLYDIAGEPSLTELTSKAIDILDNNEKGYFLVVEAGRIDHGHHSGSAYPALTDTIELSNAVQAAINTTNPEETLILVTADHSHVFTIAGYPKRGNPILGKVVNVGGTEPALAGDGMPYTTVGYTNGPAAGRQDLTAVDTASTGFRQESTVPLDYETHAGEDISLHASGPGAHLAQGVIEQSVVFHIINQTLGLIAK